MSSRNLDPKTGLKYRTVDLQAYSMLADKTSWGKPRGKDLFTRLHHVHGYIQKQVQEELWLYNRRILTGPDAQILAMDQNNNILHGINFASADYLGLAKNEYARDIAIQAILDSGVHSSGSPLTLGQTKYYAQLQKQLAQFWNCKALMIYSAGWLAGFGVISGLVKEHDHIVMDQLSHNCLVEGANAATKKIHRFEHLNHEAMVKMLKETRENDPDNAILVITEGLFSMDSDTPDLNLTQQACKQYNAFLLIDCAHDFGCLGESGKGNWQVQNLRDRSNVIMIGTGSKCLSTNIGFAACEDQRVIEYLKADCSAYKYTNALTPIQAATSLANLRILKSQLGKQKRKQVLENYVYLRAKLEAKGYTVFGNPCPILPLLVGNQVVCRLVARLMMDNGVHVNGIEWPVVKIGQARLRVTLMPQHTKNHLDVFVSTFQTCLEQANQIFSRSLDKMQQQQQNTERAKL